MFATEPVRHGLIPVALAGLLAACASEPASEPEAPTVAAEPAHEVGLAIPERGSFGGSLATGVMMPLGPVSAPPVVVASLDRQRAEEPVEPTLEQRALTRRKQSPPVQQPITQHLMGHISLAD